MGKSLIPRGCQSVRYSQATHLRSACGKPAKHTVGDTWLCDACWRSYCCCAEIDDDYDDED